MKNEESYKTNRNVENNKKVHKWRFLDSWIKNCQDQKSERIELLSNENVKKFKLRIIF